MCILFSQLQSVSSNNNFNYPLIKEYLQWHNIRAVLLVSCGHIDWMELEDFTNNLKINDIYTSHCDMSDEENVTDIDYQQFFVRLGYPICVVVQFECNETAAMLSEISKRTMFHYERHWLIFGTDSERMFSTLSAQYINVDAEVVIAEARDNK